MVGFDFGYRKDAEIHGSVTDFVVPVLKWEPRAVTVFFSNDGSTSQVLEQLPEQIRAGALGVIPCDPNRICPSHVEW
jgi:hypothetical protein